MTAPEPKPSLIRVHSRAFAVKKPSFSFNIKTLIPIRGRSRSFAVIATVLAVAVVVAWRIGPTRSGSSLLAMTPGRPLVAVYAANLGALAGRVAALPAAQAYLHSKARDAYADSKLALKLADRAERLSALAGMPLTVDALLDAAKGETVLALYDIGNLEFLLLTRLPAAEQAKLAFVADRAKFTQRVYDGRTYYAKIDEAAGLAFLFYQTDDLLIVASSPDLLESALYAAGKAAGQPRLTDDPDYRKALALDPAIGESDAVLFLDLGRLHRDRYFQVYWAWKNWRDFENVPAALVGFTCDGRSMRERRALLGSPSAPPPNELTYQGEGLTAFTAGGAGTVAQLSALFGWDLSALGLDEKAAARLLVVAPHVDPTTGLVDARRGAVLAAPGIEPARAVESVAAALREKRPALRGKLTPKTGPDGAAALTLLPGLPGVYAARQGDLLLLADDPDFLKQLAAQTRAGRPGPLWKVRNDGAAATALGDFLRQAARLGAVQGEGAEFTAGPLIDILNAAGAFGRLEAVARPVDGGVLGETLWQ
jgi:hypothetical protein